MEFYLVYTNSLYDSMHSMQSTNIMTMLMVIKNDPVMKAVIMLFIVDMTVKAELLEK